MFCSKCGTKMVISIIGAERLTLGDAFGEWSPFPAYSPETGERQYVKKYECPHKRWWNGHDVMVSRDLYKGE